MAHMILAKPEIIAEIDGGVYHVSVNIDNGSSI